MSQNTSAKVVIYQNIHSSDMARVLTRRLLNMFQAFGPDFGTKPIQNQ